jgi:pimeloyl-ACP methyl ester carboxylesterase
MWSRLMPDLAAAGYRCLAPDQRGYSPGARPDDVEAYRYRELASDVLALADAWGAQRFHLVGHDWGSLAGWAVVDVAPERVGSYTAMSVAHARAFAEAVRDDPEEQPYRDIHAIFLAPGTFEAVASENDWSAMRNAWSESDGAEIDAYLEVFRQPGALTAALNWYRASRAHARSLEDADIEFGPVDVPTLLIWGKNDAYVRRMSVERAAPLMRGPYRVAELDAGHWLAQQQPDRVRDEILAHLRANRLG